LDILTSLYQSRTCQAVLVGLLHLIDETPSNQKSDIGPSGRGLFVNGFRRKVRKVSSFALFLVYLDCGEGGAAG